MDRAHRAKQLKHNHFQMYNTTWLLSTVVCQVEKEF